MGKKKKSSFVRQQTYNRHLEDQFLGDQNRKIRRSENRINQYTAEMENYNKEQAESLLKDLNLDAEKVPPNSRIFVYELLKKSLTDKRKEYETAIQTNTDDKLIDQYLEAIEVCDSNLEQLRWLYDWVAPMETLAAEKPITQPIELAKQKLSQNERYKDLNLNDILEKIKTSARPTYKRRLSQCFMFLCWMMVINDLDKYHTYFSNTLKNLLILDSKDPIVDKMYESIDTRWPVDPADDNETAIDEEMTALSSPDYLKSLIESVVSELKTAHTEE